ncbi:MAG: hypothetical protein RR011_02590 [Oscillospiraceae bacterium]
MFKMITTRSWAVLGKSYGLLLSISFCIGIGNRFVEILGIYSTVFAIAFAMPFSMGARHAFLSAYNGNTTHMGNCWFFFKSFRKFFMSIVFSLPSYLLYLIVEVFFAFVPETSALVLLKYPVLILGTMYTETLIYAFCFDNSLFFSSAVKCTIATVKDNFKSLLLLRMFMVISSSSTLWLIEHLNELFTGSLLILLFICLVIIVCYFIFPCYIDLFIAGVYESIFPKEIGGKKFSADFYNTSPENPPVPTKEETPAPTAP